MLKLIHPHLLIIILYFNPIFAQDLCPQFLLDSAMIVNIEGKFINQQNTRTSINIEWRHHPEALDSFFINFPKERPIMFVTAGDSRYLKYASPEVKRQLGLHHLRESIGDTPLKYDDFELLANGLFLCKDSSKSQKVFSTAFSNMWWSMIVDTLPEPQKVTMRGAKKETRTFSIGAWKYFSKEKLPTLVSLTSANYSGNIWIRSAYPIETKKGDPILEKAKKNPLLPQNLFRKTLVDRKREIPLILKLNQELLRE